MPVSGSKFAQFTLVLGCACDAPYATVCNGNRCPTLTPVAAVTNGSLNSVGAALVSVNPYGGLPLMIPADSPSNAL